MIVHAGCVKFIFKILDFYNVKSNSFVKLANLAVLTWQPLAQKFFSLIFLDRNTYLLIYIFIIDV